MNKEKKSSMKNACNIYKYYYLTQSYKHVTLASSYTHTYSAYTKAGRCLSQLKTVARWLHHVICEGRGQT